MVSISHETGISSKSGNPHDTVFRIHYQRPAVALGAGDLMGNEKVLQTLCSGHPGRL